MKWHLITADLLRECFIDTCSNKSFDAFKIESIKSINLALLNTDELLVYIDRMLDDSPTDVVAGIALLATGIHIGIALASKLEERQIKAQ